MQSKRIQILQKLIEIFGSENSQNIDMNDIYGNASQFLIQIIKNSFSLLNGSEYHQFFMNEKIVSILFKEIKVMVQIYSHP